jgi:putative FmdB family regulatory protein
MPLYEYECIACGVRFERRQHMADDPVELCPECGGEVRRLIQPVGVVFKGKGFYVTENKQAQSSTVAGAGK